MHKPQEQVRDFHRAVKAARPARPLFAGLSYEEHCLRMSLIHEEVSELEDANTVPAQIQELCDILYVVYGYAVAMGVDLEPYFEVVHAANMEKAGGPKREDGKQLKPEGWESPEQAITDKFLNKQEESYQ